MATAIQENLKAKNQAYAASFTQGDLALPPAKKYVVGASHTSLDHSSSQPTCCRQIPRAFVSTPP